MPLHGGWPLEVETPLSQLCSFQCQQWQRGVEGELQEGKDFRYHAVTDLLATAQGQALNSSILDPWAGLPAL